MKRWLALGLSLLVLTTELSAVSGNVGPIPGLDVPPKGQEVKLIVKVDEKATMPRLEVPWNLAITSRLFRFGLEPENEPAAQSANNDADAGRSVLSLADRSRPPRRATFGDAISPWNPRRSALATIMAGLALALAFVTGGLWLVRRRWGWPVAVLLVLALSAATIALLGSDAPPPLPAAKPKQFDLPVLQLPANIDKLLLQVVPNGDHLTLIVPKSMVMEKEKEAAPRAKPGR